MNKSIKNVFKATVVLGISSIAPLALQAQQQQNVLFIAIDDLKPVLSCYGESQIFSPNIDKLANQGVVFENAYTQWSVCGPSRASLLSGMTPDGSGVRNLTTQLRDIVPDVITLPQFFKNQGYISAAYGKIFDRRNVDDGHDAVSWSNTYIDPGRYSYPSEYGSFVSGQYRVTANTSTEQGPEGVGFDGYQDGQIYLDALSKLNELAENPNQPFFLAVGFKKPHIPFIAPKEYWDLYDRENIEIAPFQKQAEGSPDYAYYKPEPLGYDDIPELWTYDDIEMGDGLLHPDDQRRLIHGYYACVSYVDDLVGKLLTRLEETGLADNTIIVLWGDHGYQLGDHNQWGKHTNFENSVHSPLIISIPDGIPGRSNESVELSDIYPTLVDLAGYEVPSYLQGSVLSPILQNESINKTCAVSEFRNGGHASYSFRTSQYRMTIWNTSSVHRPDIVAWNPNNIHEVELYDYLNDPLETINFYSDPNYQDVADSLLSIAENWWYEQYMFFETGINPKYEADFNYVLENSGFEEGIETSWEIEVFNDFQADIINSPLAYEGTNALSVNVITASQANEDAMLISPVYQCLSGLREETVTVSAYAKGTNSGDVVRFALKKTHFNGDEEITESSDSTLSNDYELLTYNFDLEESVASWQVMLLFGKTTGNIFIDNIELKLASEDLTSNDLELDYGQIFYPNPVRDFIRIPESLVNNSTISLYNLSGQLVKTLKAESNKIDLNDVKNGSYILTIVKENQTYNQKMLVLN